MYCHHELAVPTTSERSTSRLAYPHSLSYQPSTLTRVIPEAEGMAMVNPASKVHDAGLPTMSEETMGSSVYSSTRDSGPDRAASAKAAFTSATVTDPGITAVKSVIEPS